ncbi:hypothetical protein HU200_005207 [Digitaria exilis]|uniref:Uncharacterized protein n=1 Tax=Digitaria exilis TaxID=1010633 RepID=A0A835KSR5_9POAL|nr:hypothetical protein HU200_005362 [Digitaria exilis]KAF8772823.1 hypothetical protein HU200_005207 [Digitaria exilis]
MAAAVADAAAASRQPPGPGPALRCPELAAVKALMFPCIAALWIRGATAAAAAMTHMVHPSAVDPIFLLILSSWVCILLDLLLSVVVFVLLLRAALRDSDSILEACGPSLRSLLRETTLVRCAAAQILDVLSVVGCFVAMELSMVPRSLAGWIGALSIDVVVVISAAICCFDILPVSL